MAPEEMGSKHKGQFTMSLLGLGRDRETGEEREKGREIE
jgi:hypothetical protein